MKVLCVGRNYAKHARELGNPLPPPAAPIWFWKPESAIVPDGADLVLPRGIGAVHHECELAVRIGRRLRRVAAEEAVRHVDAVTVANDATARELQQAAQKAGLPWAQAKGYDTFLPLGAWQPWRASDGPDLQAQRLRLSVGGAVRQDASTRDMVNGVAALLAHAGTWTTLEPGDIVLTGTPEGVGPMPAGQEVVCELVGIARLRHHVVDEA